MNLIHDVSKPSKARAVKMRALFLHDGSFCGKRNGFHVTVASHEGLDKLVEIFRGEVSSFRKFSSALLKQLFELYHLSKDAANKECISHSTNIEWTL